MPSVKAVTDTAGFYEFRVLLFLPGQFPSGIRARLRIRHAVLEFNAPGVWITLLADQVSLNPGGFDGRQWVLSWETEAGRALAMLTGEADLRALRRLAPPTLAQQIDQALGQAQRRRRLVRGWLALLLFVVLLSGLALVLL
ncbi:MAG: hypothetical protein ACK4TK_00480 [Thiobacillaceae bacterium]